MKTKAEKRLYKILQMVQNDMMSPNLSKKLKQKTNQWDSWREQG